MVVVRRKWRDHAEIVSAWWLDLDDIGAEVCQQLGAKGSGVSDGAVDNREVGQRAGCVTLCH